MLGTRIRASRSRTGCELAMFGMGCFWGAEKKFWGTSGMWTTMVGLRGGVDTKPDLSGGVLGPDGHNEVVRAVFETAEDELRGMLRIFWEGHDRPRACGRGTTSGTQYRSGIYWMSEAQREAARASKAMFQEAPSRAGFGEITTEIVDARPSTTPRTTSSSTSRRTRGYCGLGGTGVSCPAPATAASE